MSRYYPLLALNLTIVPLLIAAITFAGHRWGPAVSGWLAGLPVVAGPVLFFIAIENGPGFAATAAVGTLAGVAGAVAFAIVYAWVAKRFAWPTGFGCGLAAYFSVVDFKCVWRVGVTYRKDTYVSPVARRFIQILKATAEEMAAE